MAASRPPLETVRARLRGLKSRIDRHRPSWVNVQRELGVVAPSSAASYRQTKSLTLAGARSILPALVDLQNEVGAPGECFELTAEDFCTRADAVDTAMRLREKFDSFGSDKGRGHGYHYVYGRILKDVRSPGRLLEIGIGTNNTDVVSNMGADGVPGASLRAFRQFLGTFEIYGADIDRRILFDEPGIKTFFCDQTDWTSLVKLREALPRDFDVVIDDGLHAPHANVTTLRFGLGIVGPSGWLVIEDITRDHLPVWRLVASMLPRQSFRSYIIRAQDKYLFVAQKAPYSAD
jgi:hypothetical protein